MEMVFSQLFSQIKAINKKYENISAITGEGYNIFKILKMQSAENRLHSAFIANLLNPKGSHGQKDVFLRLFIEHVIAKEFDFDASHAEVEVEKHVGFKNADQTEGGRIDICITDKKRNQIIIENKIFAPDQENQLVRYSNYNKKACLIYLCLDSNRVSEFSCKGLVLDLDYQIITYKSQIIHWLSYCKKEAVSHPILRETITQYINLIKHLTGQTINKEMKNEIVAQITSSKDTLIASFEIANNLDKACNSLLKDLKLQVEEIGQELSLRPKFNIDFDEKFTGIIFYLPGIDSVKISFQFQNYHRNLIYGVSRNAECKDLNDPITVGIYNVLRTLGGRTTPWWPFCKDADSKYQNWDNYNKHPWLAIIDGSMKSYIKEKVVEINVLLKDKIVNLENASLETPEILAT